MSKALQEEIAGSFLVLLDSLISQLLTSQPFVQAVLDSKLGKLQNRFRPSPWYDMSYIVVSRQAVTILWNLKILCKIHYSFIETSPISHICTLYKIIKFLLKIFCIYLPFVLTYGFITEKTCPVNCSSHKSCSWLLSWISCALSLRMYRLCGAQKLRLGNILLIYNHITSGLVGSVNLKWS